MNKQLFRFDTFHILRTRRRCSSNLSNSLPARYNSTSITVGSRVPKGQRPPVQTPSRPPKKRSILDTDEFKTYLSGPQEAGDCSEDNVQVESFIRRKPRSPTRCSDGPTRKGFTLRLGTTDATRPAGAPCHVSPLDKK